MELNHFTISVIALMIAIVIASIVVYFLYRWISRDGHLGYLAKICHLMGVKLDSIEKRRWMFFPHDTLMRSDTLIVSFAGGAMKISGIPYTEFRRSLSNFKCDQLYVMDPTGMTWYLQDPTSNWNGYKYYESELRQITKNYSKCMFIGNCMGGSGALMMSHLATKVVVFNPHVDTSIQPSKIMKFANWMLPSSMKREVYRLIDQNVSSTKAIVHVHCSKNEEARHQTTLLPHNVKVTLYDTNKGASAYLKENGKLIPLITEEFEEMIAT